MTGSATLRRETVAKHGQATYRLYLGDFILKHVPMFREQAVFRYEGYPLRSRRQDDPSRRTCRGR